MGNISPLKSLLIIDFRTCESRVNKSVQRLALSLVFVWTLAHQMAFRAAKQLLLGAKYMKCTSVRWAEMAGIATEKRGENMKCEAF